ncbi:MAG: hypothetical protein IKL24_02765 [Clostridia bacterium]|nr:hypothetical protein [Clostridia bacterium]
MIVLYILLGIILFFALILSLHIKVFIKLDDGLRLRVGLGPVVLTLSPKKKKKVKASDFTYKKHQKRLLKDKKKKDKKAKKQAEKEEKKKQAKLLKKEAETAAEASEEAAAGNKLGTILELIKFVLLEIPIFASYIKTDVRKLIIIVGGKDADVTARSFGAVSAIVANLMELLSNKTQLRPVRENTVGVFADFTAEKITYNLDLYFKLRLFSIVRVGWHALKWFISQKIKESKTQAAGQHKIQK